MVFLGSVECLACMVRSLYFGRLKLHFQILWELWYLFSLQVPCSCSFLGFTESCSDHLLPSIQPKTQGAPGQISGTPIYSFIALFSTWNYVFVWTNYMASFSLYHAPWILAASVALNSDLFSQHPTWRCLKYCQAHLISLFSGIRFCLLSNIWKQLFHMSCQFL